MKRWLIIACAVIFLLAAGTAVGFRIAVRMLKDKVIAALGSGSKIAELSVGWNSVELRGIDLAGPKDWPAVRTLYAERVTIVPSLASLLTQQVRISSVTVEQLYLSIVRAPGKLIVVPSLLGTGERKDRRSEHPTTRTVTISQIIVQGGVVELFDATVNRPPLKTSLEDIEALLRDIAVPSSKERTQIEFAAIVRGVRRDGRAKISGWVEAAGKNSSSHILLDAVDLVSLQPYLVKKGEARVERGTLDLNVRTEVRNNRLDGKGTAVIKDLGFAPPRGYMETFVGLPRNAVVGFLKDHQGAIDVDFTLHGDISHPNFSLNESLANRIATGMAEQLGVTVQGMAAGIGTLGREGVESAGKVTDAIGSAIRDIFGGEKR